MKKLICILTILASQANAAFIVGANNQKKFDLTGKVQKSVTLMADGIYSVGDLGSPYSNIQIHSGIMLKSSDIPKHRNEMKISLMQKYPYIDNEDVIEDLTDVLISKYQKTRDERGNAYITLNHIEITSIIKNKLQLNETEREDLIKTLSI
jgi:hypothetical protein